jgi:phospholipid/cholesterol/gamma-HCH transport system substrate-binding protein
MSAIKDVGRAAVITVLVAGSVAVAGSRIGGGDDDLVRARFVSAAPLVEGSQVKVDGVVVGSVKGLEVKDGAAEVSLDLDEAAMPLHDDALLTIRPVSLLGERFIDLDRGSPDAPVLDLDKVIPSSRTATSVGLDEVLNTMDDPTGEGLRGLVGTLGEGMQGNGRNADEALRALSPSLRETRALAAVLRDHNALLSRLVEDFEPVAGALAVRDGKAMDQLVESSDQVLGAVRERQRDLDATLGNLPGTLRDLRATLGNLRSTASDTAPTLAELRPLTDRLPELSQELETFSDAMDPALASSEPVLERAEELLRMAAPVAGDARRAGPSLARTTDGLRKVSTELTRNRERLFDYIRYWALTTNGHDGLSHYFRVNASVNPATLTGLLPATQSPLDPSGKTPGGSGGGLLSDGGLLSNLLGGEDGGLLSGGLLGGGDGLLGGGGLLRESTQSSSPTGLSEQQELDLLGQLLGGR